ncbi:hypothetical protein SANTM175S_06871 [Streptomyces antimycoticus]
MNAAVALQDKMWGTDAVLRLKNLKGPLDCSLIAISKDGHEQTMTTWSVPPWGYGIEDSPRAEAREPLWARRRGHEACRHRTLRGPYGRGKAPGLPERLRTSELRRRLILLERPVCRNV